MKKMKMRVAALLGALALTAWGIGMAGCTHDAGLKISDLVGSDMDDGGDGGPGGPGPGTPTSNITLTSSNGQYSYATIQAALGAIPTGGTGTYTITLQPETYNENGLTYNGSATVIIKGNTTEEYGADVIVMGHGSNMATTKGRELLEFQGSGNLILENITFISDYSRADHSGSVQAELVGFDSTGYVAAYNCAFKSHQDTLRTTGKAWFYRCYVEGDVDFLWMESSGIVALYEECEIVSVYDANYTEHETKICAPRMSPASKAGKGLVIYNSTVREDENGASQKTYLARTPWGKSDGYWNQVAYIKTSIFGVETTPSPWYDSAIKSTYNDCNTADGIARNIIGWKIDRTSADSFGYMGLSDQSDIVSETDVANEFSGRRAILNRLYDTKAEKYTKDSETHWDIDTFILGRGWSVTADTSKDLLDGETEAKVTVYEFTTAKDITSYTDLTVSGFANESGKNHVQGPAGSTIKVPVTGKAVVTVTGYFRGLGTIQAEGQGKALFDFNNNSTNNTDDKPYVVYANSADTVTITAEDTTYITKIKVEYDDSLEFTPVATITVSAEDNATTVAAKKTLQFSASLTPAEPTNSDILWSIVSGGEAAKIDERSGLLTALAPTVDTPVTVKVTSLDANGVSETKSIIVLKLSEDAGSISWAPDNAEVVSLAADNSGAKELATGSNFEMYWADEKTPIVESELAIGTGRNHTSVGYSKTGVAVGIGDTILTYHFPVAAGSSAITLTNFAYKLGCNTTNNIYGTVSVIGSGGNSMYEGEPLQSGTTDGYKSDGIVASEELPTVSVAANQTVTVVVTITAKNDFTTNNSPFVIADVVLDFEKQ